MMHKKGFEKRLLAYKAMAAGILSFPAQVEGQILYTDLFEDKVIGDTSGYIFDLNYDLVHDFFVFQAFSPTANFVNVHRAKNTEILGKSTGNYLYPFALDAGYIIDTINKNWKIRDYGTLNWQGTAGNYGYWQGVQDKYLGIKIKIDGKPYLGWARLDVAQNGKSFTVKDYAVEFTSGKSITTGSGANTYGVTKINAIDLGNGSGLKISFNKSFDESRISEYRVMLKNVTDSTHLTPNLALNLSPPNVIVVPKTGNDHELLVNSGNVDIQGKPLKIGNLYQIYVLSMPDGNLTNEPILSTNKKYFSMEVLSSPAGKPLVSDVGNNGNGQDIKVKIIRASEEEKVSFYRIIVCKSDIATSFTIDDAKKLHPSRYTDVNKTGNDIEIILSPVTKDTDGDLIKNNVRYRILVMSIADGINASKNVFSPPSEEFMLINTSGIANNEEIRLKYFFSEKNLYLNAETNNEIDYIGIYDINGKQVCYLKTPKVKTFTIPFHQQARGIYLLKIATGGNYYTKKIVY